MKKEQFKLKLVETLPPLKPAEVESLVKFMQVNSNLLLELINLESCCAEDDIQTAMGICSDAIELGYGLQSLPEYLADLRGEDD